MRFVAAYKSNLRADRVRVISRERLLCLSGSLNLFTVIHAGKATYDSKQHALEDQAVI